MSRRTSLLHPIAMCLLALAFLQVETNFTQAQVEQIDKLLGRNKINSDFIPNDAMAAAVTFPKKIAEDPKLDIIPREIISAWGKKELGFDPLLIKQATFFVKETDSLETPPQWAGVLHFEEMQGLAGKTIDDLEEKSVGKRVLFSGASRGLPSFLVYDEVTLFVGDETLFEGMIESDNTGRVSSLARRSSVKGEVQAFGNIEMFRPVLNQMMEQIPAMLPPAIGKLKEIPGQVNAIEVGLTIDASLLTQLVLHCPDGEAAEEVAETIMDALEFGMEMGVGMMATQMDFDDPVQEATVEYVERFAEHLKVEMKPAQEGSKVKMNLRQEVTVLPFLVGMALPAVQQVRAAARRTQSMNNARQVSLAMHNYQSAYGKLPAQASYDKNGKPLLSWRVHILPFIEQQELYDQFHLDEPWDSPHNKKLMKKIPPIYASPSSAAAMQGKTVYLGVAGKGLAFSDKAINFSNMTDGASNTVWTVEVNDEAAVPWTKPEDWSPDERDPMRGLGRLNPGGFIVGMADGSVQFMSNTVDPESWKAMLTIGGGEAVNAFEANR